MVEKKTFVISPIGPANTEIRREADWVLDDMIKPALEPKGFKVQRADDFSATGMITTKVILGIQNADLIVADMSGRNANVFYELGVAHSYRKPVIPLMREGDEIPFDTAPLGTIFYSRENVQVWAKAKADLSRAAVEAVEPNHIVSNPVTVALGHKQLMETGDPRDKAIAALQDTVSALSRDFAQFKNSPPHSELLEAMMLQAFRERNGTALRPISPLQISPREHALAQIAAKEMDAEKQRLGRALTMPEMASIVVKAMDAGPTGGVFD